MHVIPRCSGPTDGWRRLAAGAALALGAACAHVEAPPGGEPDTEPPRLEATRPDTFARMRSYVGPVVFSFNEGLSEKGIDTVVTVSPRTSGVAVDKHGREVRVELRRGWEANRIYQVTLHPGVSDLFGNATKQPVTVVFSTGPEIVHTMATGTVIERATLRPATGAVVEAVHRPDSVTYVTRPDSAGVWRLEYLPAGDYLVRAYNDTNKDQKLQPYEARDTVAIRVTVRDTVRARRLALLAPDSTAPKAGTASGDGDRVEVRFDDFLDPTQPLSPSQVTITGPAGAVRVAEVRVGPFPEARGDSAAADTGAAARRDTTPREPVPSQSLFIRTAAPLAAETQYTARVTGVRNLVGLVGGGEAPLKTPKAAPAPPAAAPSVAPGDSGRAVPRPPAAPAAPPPAPRPATSPRPVAAPPRGALYRPNRPHLPSF
ncbi:MAG TPA: Ig-like domain-containing protein [Longimicrobium sp.]|nr:Ig-like domain-containing protein [Longimicrobium sp.]